jgi:hypothetical protein
MLVARPDNIGGATVATVARNRFASLVALAEEKLRAEDAGATLAAIVEELRALAAESDEVNEAMCEHDDLALRFDSVVAAWKELR